MLLLVFTVRLNKPELVVPCKPTPRGMKQLSHIDKKMILRFQLPILILYPAGKKRTGGEEGDVGKVIKKALGEVLVYYYPWAGRMRESEEGNLAVDCTGEGVLFMEAEADVPCSEDLLFDVPGSSD